MGQRRSLVFKCRLESLERVYSISHAVTWPLRYPMSRREWGEQHEALNADVPQSSGLRLTSSSAIDTRMVAFASGPAWPKIDWPYGAPDEGSTRQSWNHAYWSD